MQLTRQQAVLAAMFPVVALGALNHFYKLPLYRAHPGWYWAADALQFAVLPALAAWFLLRPAGIRPADLGLPRHKSLATTVFAALVLLLATWPVDSLPPERCGSMTISKSR